MKLEEIYKKGRSYPQNFFYGDMFGNIKLYEFQEGIFLLGNTSEEMELLWGVNKLEDLKYGIEKVKNENPYISFIFRYGGNLKDVIEKKEIINKWGYRNKEIYVRYNLSFDNTLIGGSHRAFEYLEKNETKEFFSLEREVFDSLNVSEEELQNWLNNGDHIILTYKESGKIIAFIIIELYGTNNQNCLIRNLGVSKTERSKGIGKELILFGLEEARKKGASKAMLWVGYDNVIARNLYEKIGFILDEDESEVIFQV